MNGDKLITLNKKSIAFNANSDRSLLYVLNTDYSLTSAKYGCGKGRCGSYKRIMQAIKLDA